MKRFVIFLVILFFSVNFLNAQKKPTSQTNYSLDFNTFLSGVKYAEVQLDKEDYNFIIDSDFNNIPSIVLAGLSKYLTSMNFDDYTISWNNSIIRDYMTSECDKVNVHYYYDFKNNIFSNISIVWESCNGDEFEFRSNRGIKYNGNTSSLLDSFYFVFSDMYPYKKPPFSLRNRLKLKRYPTSWSENSLKENWVNKGIDLIEGIYEESKSSSKRYKVGLVKTNTGYSLIYLSGALWSTDWDVGEVKAELTHTATTNFFKTIWVFADKSFYDGCYVSFEEGLMKVIIGSKTYLFIKLYPTVNDNTLRSRNQSKSASGTGFGISSNGIIATNYHVIDDAKSIKVRGVNSDFNKTYNAKVLVSDKNNDLALIQIDDYGFSSLGTIPYTIKTRLAEVGENIFVLGYPLRATMGDEIKLTNGIISSRTGFQGDITSYQISAPVQPGNSGGPLFDGQGNLIGIINAKHDGAENASYAVKTSFLTNLIELLPSKPKIQTINTLTGKTLTQQVELVKKFVYIIEVE